MELRHLRYFVAAVEEGSLQRAAHRVNVAQPALLRRIRDLETELGCLLLQRHSRGVSPTPAGTQFYRSVLTHLAGIDQAADIVRQRGERESQQVRLGLLQNSRRYGFVNQAIADFRTERGDVALSFTRELSPRLLERLRERQLDLAFLHGDLPQGTALGHALIHCESLILALHPDHAMAAPRPIALQEIAGVPLIWLSLREGNEYHDALQQRLREHGIETVIALRADSYEDLIDLTVASGGACITAASTVLAVPDGALTFRPIQDMPMDLHLTLAWNQGLDGLPAGTLLQGLQTAIARHQDDIRAGRLAWSHLYGENIVSAPG